MATYVPGSKPRITEAGNRAVRLAAEKKRKEKKQPKKKKTKGSVVEGVDIYPHLSTGPSTGMITEIKGETKQTPLITDFENKQSEMPPPLTETTFFDKLKGGFESVKNFFNPQEEIAARNEALNKFISGEKATAADIDAIRTIIPGLGGGTKTTTTAAKAALKSGGIESLIKLGYGEAVKTTAKEIATNTKTISIVKSILSKKFTTTALAAAGAWAGAVFLGKWGEAESTEPLGIIMSSQLIPDAIQTGDWGLVEEAQAARNEILDLTWWEKIGLWSPVSPFIGIPKKIEGAIAAASVQDKIIEDLKTQQENGETEDQKWERIRQEEKEAEKAIIDYYNQERKKLLKWEREAAKQAREEEARFWAKEREKQRKQEEEDRKAAAEFWLAYRKMVMKMQEESRPSKLNFGII